MPINRVSFAAGSNESFVEFIVRSQGYSGRMPKNLICYSSSTTKFCIFERVS